MTEEELEAIQVKAAQLKPLYDLAARFHCPPEEVPSRADALLAEVERLRAELVEDMRQ